MNLHSVKPASGSTHNSKRIGRGQGSGKGGTATKGHKGQKSRSGYAQKIGFEGGQMPLQRRLPKFGFKNVNRKEYVGINLDTLQTLADSKNLTEINKDILKECGVIKGNESVKILGRGDFNAKINVTVDKFTKSAEAAIIGAGGQANVL